MAEAHPPGNGVLRGQVMRGPLDEQFAVAVNLLGEDAGLLARGVGLAPLGGPDFLLGLLRPAHQRGRDPGQHAGVLAPLVGDGPVRCPPFRLPVARLRRPHELDLALKGVEPFAQRSELLDHLFGPLPVDVLLVRCLEDDRDQLRGPTQALGRRRQRNVGGAGVDRVLGELVGLVDADDRLAQVAQDGFHTRARLKVGQKQGVVGQQDVRVAGLASRHPERALLVVRTAAPGAAARGGGDRHAHRIGDPLWCLVHVAIPLPVTPAVGQAGNGARVGSGWRAGEQRVLEPEILTAAGGAQQVAHAHVALTPLHQRDLFLAAAGVQQGGQFAQQLLLQRDGPGGNHQPLARARGQGDGRDQVPQRLAAAGSGLDHRHATGLRADRPRHLGDHLVLRTTGAKARHAGLHLLEKRPHRVLVLLGQGRGLLRRLIALLGHCARVPARRARSPSAISAISWASSGSLPSNSSCWMAWA